LLHLFPRLVLASLSLVMTLQEIRRKASLRQENISVSALK
jgi:hypothetical protein